MIKLNCGCGGKILPKEEGWVNIDIDKKYSPDADLYFDLQEEKWPYRDGTVDYVLLQDILEHIARTKQDFFLSEVVRVLKPRGEVFIQTPNLRINAMRYVGILDAGMQHKISAEQFCLSLYAWDHSIYATHRWAYDEESLKAALEKAGLYVTGGPHSDGGSNMLCNAKKPPIAWFLPLGGGLGDSFQTYMSGYGDKWPSTDLGTGYWFQCLPIIKKLFPDIKVVVFYVGTAKKPVLELIETNPYIDEVQNWGYEKSSELYSNLSLAYNGAIYPNEFFKKDDLIPTIPKIYYTKEDIQTIKSIKDKGKYIVIHPFAGGMYRNVLKPCDYVYIAGKLKDAGYNSIVIGSEKCDDFTGYEYIGNLIGKINARVSYGLIENSCGFVGTHSSMILGAWYWHKPNICFVPEYHDDGKTAFTDFFNSDNPSACYANKPFSKYSIVNKDDDEDKIEKIDYLVNWLLGEING